MMKKKMIVNDILCLFSCFFLMGCNAIKEDNTKVYVDSYSQTALQQADADNPEGITAFVFDSQIWA